MLAFAIGGAMLYAVYLQMTNIVNIPLTKDSHHIKPCTGTTWNWNKYTHTTH